MNILFINSIAPRKYGGGEKWMIKAAKGLTREGHKVFLASKINSEILKFAEKEGVNTQNFNIYTDFSPVNTWKIYKFLKSEQIDVLICNLNKDVRVAGLAAKFAHTPLVVARHGMLLCGKKWKHKITLKNLIDGIITNTNTIKDTYHSYGWFKNDFIKVIYNGIEDKSYVQPFDFSNKFPNKKIIFSAGRLSDQKGFPWLIEAANILCKKRNDLTFIIAGIGREEKRLKDLIKSYNIENSFHLFGFIENVDPYIKGCDLFVLSSLFEGMPNVVMEAMALSKAVIATDVNGVRELMEDGKTGIIIPAKDSKILADRINELIDDNDHLQQFGKNGLERVKNDFTVDKMVLNIEEYFINKLNEKTKFTNKNEN